MNKVTQEFTVGPDLGPRPDGMARPVLEWVEAVQRTGNGWAHVRPYAQNERMYMLRNGMDLKTSDAPPFLPQATFLPGQKKKSWRGKEAISPAKLAIRHVQGSTVAHDLELPDDWTVEEDDKNLGLHIELAHDCDLPETFMVLMDRLNRLATIPVIPRWKYTVEYMEGV